MELLTLQSNKEDAGQRADAVLARRVEDLTRSAAARLLEEGRVTSSGKALAKNTRLTGTETLEIALPDPEPVDVRPQDIPLDIVYEDADVIVVNKPKGLVVHPAPGHPDGTLVNALLHHCGESLSGIGGELRPGIVHRIDRDTSGLIIAAKNDLPIRSSPPSSGPYPLPDLPVHRGGQSSGGRRHCERPHRPPSHGPQEDGGGGERPPRRDPLAGAGAVPGLYLCGVPAGDGPDPPDPGPHGLSRPSHPGGYGVRGQKARPRSSGPVPPRGGTAVPPSPDRGDGGAYLRTAGGIQSASSEAPGDVKRSSGPIFRPIPRGRRQEVGEAGSCLMCTVYELVFLHTAQKENDYVGNF